MNDLVASSPSVSRSLASLTSHPLLHFFCMARDVKWGAGYSPRSREARNKQRSSASACTACAGRASASWVLEDKTEPVQEYLDGGGGVRSVNRLLARAGSGRAERRSEYFCFDVDVDSDSTRIGTHDELCPHATNWMDGANAGFAPRDPERAYAYVRVLGRESSNVVRELVGYESSA
jgi:hypothetical protein